MRQPIEEGGGHDRVAKDVGPLTELEITRQEDRPPLIPFGEELKEELACARSQGK